MEFAKRHRVITGCIIIVILGICVFNICNYGWKEFFKFSAYDVITIIIALFVTYYLTERKHDIRKLNNKIESICSNLQTYLREEYKVIPSKENKEKVLINIRYISNKIHILEKLSERNKDIKESIMYIKKEHEKYNEFVTDNLDQSETYFLEENRKEKIETYINNMDNKLDEIMVYLYTGKLPTIHNEKE